MNRPCYPRVTNKKNQGGMGDAEECLLGHQFAMKCGAMLPALSLGLSSTGREQVSGRGEGWGKAGPNPHVPMQTSELQSWLWVASMGLSFHV